MTPDVHPPAEVLAAYAAGDLGHADATAVAGHLAGCAACAQDLAAVERATQALAALPDLTMPDDVVSAIGEAIRREAEPVRPPTPIDRTSRERRRLMPFAAAAAAVGLAAAVGYGATRDGGGAARDSQIAAGDATGAAAGPRVLQSGNDYTQQGLDAQVRAVLVGGAAGAAEGGAVQEDAAGTAARSGESADAPLAATAGVQMRAAVTPDDAALTSCVVELAGSDDVVPVLVDIATYSGQPAWVVVLPFRDDTVDVFVVRPDCRPGDSALLYFERVTRS